MRYCIGFILLLEWMVIGASYGQIKSGGLTASYAKPNLQVRSVIIKLKANASGNSKSLTRDLVVSQNIPLFNQIGAGPPQLLFPRAKASVPVKQQGRQAGQKEMVDLTRLYRLEIAPNLDLEYALKLLRAHPAVEYAEQEYMYEPLDAYVPNDPMAQLSGGQQYYLKNIHAYEAWEIEKGDSHPVVVGVTDTGCLTSHEDLVNKIQYNTADPINGVDDDKDGYVDNYAGFDLADNDNNVSSSGTTSLVPHGTSVAGVIAAEVDNNKGIAGVGFKTKILPLKIFSAEGNAFKGFEAIVYAVEKGCKVINLSWGRTGGPSQYEQDIINYAALTNDVVVVSSAGNNNTAQLFYPASYDNVISVAATDINDVKNSVSSFNSRVNISAPGELILSTYSYPTGNNIEYTPRSGTSVSAPMVAAAAALLRSHFPDWNAAKVAQRLLLTADDIYQNPENLNYNGQLGVGRLNIFRALTVSKAVRYTKQTISGYKGQSVMWPGQNSSLSMEFTNYLDPLDNLQVTLSSRSPYVEIKNSIISLGSLATNSIAANTSQPFTVYVKPDVPVNTPIIFTLTYRDGSFTSQESLVITVNPDYLDIDVNQVKLTVGSQGRLGYSGDFTSKGNGFQYKNQSLLYEAGLMIGISAAQVSDCVQDSTTQYTKDKNFTYTKPVYFNTSNGADRSAAGRFNDTTKYAGKIGLSVDQYAYAWREAPLDKGIIVEYRIKNISGKDISQVYAGIFADWDIGELGNNQANWDAANRMGYMFNIKSAQAYVGIQLLTDQDAQYYALDDVSGMSRYDGFSSAEKFKTISGGIARPQSAANAGDVAHAIGAALANLKSGETRMVAFAFLAGDNLADLQQSAAAIRQKFIRIKTSPVPVIAQTQFCKDQNKVVKPSNGTHFKLYTALPITSPVASGQTFDLGRANKDSTVYISGTDSLYESVPVAVTVQVVEPKAAYTISRDTVDLRTNKEVQFTNQSTGAYQWEWNFGDGTSTAEANPSHRFDKAGEYMVTLKAYNGIGCADSLSKKMWVKLSPLREVAKAVELYPNPSTGMIWLVKDRSLANEKLSVQIVNSTGQVVYQGEINGETWPINLMSVAKGMYQLRMSLNGKMLMKRLVIL